MLKTSAIIVTFNRLAILKKDIKHLIAQSYNLNNIIVVNNDSTDGTSKYLDNLHNLYNSYIYHIHLSKNIGGAGGFSLGMKYAYENTDSDYYWVMDDDALPTKDALKNLLISVKDLNNNFGFLSSNVRFNNTNLPTNVPVVSHDWTKLLPGNLIKLRESSFVSFFTHRTIVKKVGLPIGRMFIWGDDCEYTNRISHKYDSYLVTNSIVLHYSKVNNNNQDKATNIFNTNRIIFYKYSYRNYLFINKKFNGYEGFIKKLIGDIKSLIEIPFLSKSKRCKRMYYVIIGIIEGLFFDPEIKFPSRDRRY